ncbi:hypothetical protein BDQ17DRAFT_1319079 [Cyathus striatus]|nr:hypothetical protein BDQ17DRAFT_1319079 [Cyathus striatus]
MYIPFLSPPTSLRLSKRKGGGGGGRGGGGGTRCCSSSSSSNGGISGSRGTTGGGNAWLSSFGVKSKYTISSSGQSYSSSSSGSGISKSTISSGAFAGRDVGGGTKDDIYGSSVYGSGYPEIPSRGVSNRGFPFVFYPIVFPQSAGPTYLYAEQEYGKVNDSIRPGGPLTQISLSTPSYTLRITSDETTITSLSNTLSSSLSSPLSTCSSANISLTEPIPLNSSTEAHPKPEEAIQYYRASSVVLSLDGFNNSIAYSKNVSTFLYASVPGYAVDGNVVSCVNRTVGENVLLPNAGVGSGGMYSMVVGLVWFVGFCRVVF